jgi:hypothetical protein
VAALAFTIPHSVCVARRAQAPFMAFADDALVPLGTTAAVALLGAAAVLASGGNNKEAGVADSAFGISIGRPDLQSKIARARSSAAQTYRFVDEEEEDETLTPEMQAERKARRQRTAAMAEAMLEEALNAVRDGLEEARLMGDDDSVTEYEALLERMRTNLPGSIVPTTPAPDFKRWLDPERRL